jgi:hypothetical protein
MLIDEFLCKREVLGKRTPHSFTPPLSVLGVSNKFSSDTWILSGIDSLSSFDNKDFSWMIDNRVGLVDILLVVFDQLHFRRDMRRHVESYMLWLGRFSFALSRIELVAEVHWREVMLDSGDVSLRH